MNIFLSPFSLAAWCDVFEIYNGVRCMNTPVAGKIMLWLWPGWRNFFLTITLNQRRKRKTGEGKSLLNARWVEA